jgi:hypothetical protein
MIFPVHTSLRENTVSKNNKNDSLIGTLVAGAIALPISACVIAMLLLLKFCYGWAKPQIMEGMRLDELSSEWRQRAWLYHSIAWVSGLLCFFYLFSSIVILSLKGATPIQMITAASHIPLAILLGFPFLAVRWIWQCESDPDIQRTVAGRKAEAFVADAINDQMDQCPGSRVMHGALFVFHPGLENEYSIEIDHLLITKKHLYLIETKFKSGTIWASDTASEWKTSTVSRDGSMRNPLMQVKNSARVLKKELDLPFDIIPLVAIYGNDVLLVGAPGNVVAAENVVRAIRAFEQSVATEDINPKEIASRMRMHVCDDKLAMQKHKERAQLAKARTEMSAIVQTASLK